MPPSRDEQQIIATMESIIATDPSRLDSFKQLSSFYGRYVHSLVFFKESDQQVCRRPLFPPRLAQLQHILHTLALTHPVFHDPPRT
jgi:hypothetical protein